MECIMSSCPISGVTADERVARIVGAFVAVSVVGYLLTGWVGWLVLLSFDFFLRVFRCELSPFASIATRIRRRWFQPSNIDAAAKLFAARLGLAMAIVGLVLHVLGWLVPALGVMVLLLVAALLESALGFCLGCWLYGMMGFWGRVRGV